VKKPRPGWRHATQADKQEFIDWHEAVMERHNYPKEIRDEFRRSRDKMLASGYQVQEESK